MADPVPFRKVIILCTALAAAAGLSACDDRAMDRTFASIQAIQVDARDTAAPEQPEDRKLGPRDVQLAINTAKDLTVNKGGLLDKRNSPSKLQFAVVDALHMPRTDNNPPLDERVRGVVFDRSYESGGDAVRAAARALPDIPVAEAQLRPMQAVSRAVTTAAPDETGPRRIQIGSFGTLSAAQSAWEDLRDRYPGVERYRPAYEKVVTAKGKTMVRLKVGPVADDAQARGLCDHLAIHDAWCAKAG